ncbi:MAG: adenylosuccinate synthase [Planctomycetes bacterium]|nr:adenylosuccinate synthase [Planctomycetota bacterium]
MPNSAILGLQWGDEGKGKLVDALCADKDLCVRFQGGGNAGHTVYPDGKKIVLHHLPTGVLHKQCHNIMGQGMVVNPTNLIEEIEEVEERGYDLSGRLFLSDRLSITTPLHLQLDTVREDESENEKIGTTRRGIGPTYADRYDRIGMRMADLLDESALRAALQAACNVRNSQLSGNPPSVDSMVPELLKAGQRLKQYVADTSLLLADAVDAGQKILFEGAQGAMLDVSSGTYPFVTSSHTMGNGISSGAGLAVNVEDAIGVTKAYCTRVGEGPFMTELHDELGKKIREAGGEFGATTGRPRRCGWIDLFALKYVCRVSGIARLAVTKLDVLSGIGDIQVGVGYENYDKPGLPAAINELSALKPVYETMAGWTEDITEAKSLSDLPENAKKLLSFIEEFVGVKVGIVSVGPAREQSFEM